MIFFIYFPLFDFLKTKDCQRIYLKTSININHFDFFWCNINKKYFLIYKSSK